MTSQLGIASDSQSGLSLNVETKYQRGWGGWYSMFFYFLLLLVPLSSSIQTHGRRDLIKGAAVALRVKSVALK